MLALQRVNLHQYLFHFIKKKHGISEFIHLIVFTIILQIGTYISTIYVT